MIGAGNRSLGRDHEVIGKPVRSRSRPESPVAPPSAPRVVGLLKGWQARMHHDFFPPAWMVEWGESVGHAIYIPNSIPVERFSLEP